MYLVLVAAIILACSGCSSAQKPDPCTPQARAALLALYDKASAQVIDTGACDDVERIEDCREYAAVESDFAMTEAALCQ